MSTPVRAIFSSAAEGAALACTLLSAAWSAAPDTAAGSVAAMAAMPATTMWATRGLTQTVSAEPMGDGRLTLGLTGTWYRQKMVFSGIVPPINGDVTTGIAAFSFGVNPYIDVFASVVGYGLLATDNTFGLGSAVGGIKGSLPLPKKTPVYLGAELSVIGGTSSNQINDNFPDGYNYFETRVGYDFIGKIIESLVLGNESLGIKFHFNEGLVMSAQSGHEKLLLLAGGIQVPVHPLLVLGLEANSRTTLSKLNVLTDPLWLTPSILVRTPYYFDISIGSDISMSKDRTMSTAVRALEPYRIFGGFVFSTDLLAGKRRAAFEKAEREAAEKNEMMRKIREVQARNARLSRKAYEDSLAFAKAHELDAIKADSMAQKAREDSIALAETTRKLEEERSKRSDAEKQLLSTGLLILDAVYFESGKSRISINSFPYLNIIGKMLTKYPRLRIEVTGHTDNLGSSESNILLSQSRAEAVKKYLIQVAPELLDQLSARGYGSTQPKAPNSTAEGRKMNRRVELQVLNKDVLIEYK